MSALQRLQEFRFKKMQQASSTGRSSNQSSSLAETLFADHASTSDSTSATHTNGSSTGSSNSHGQNKGGKPAVVVLDTSDIDPESGSDSDLRKGVKEMSTNSPLRRSPQPSIPAARLFSINGAPSTRQPKTTATTSSKVGTLASTKDGKLPFKKLVTSYRYTGDGALPPPPFDSDHSLSSPGQSDVEDVDMVEGRTPDVLAKASDRMSSMHSKMKRQIVSSDEDEEIDVEQIKPRRRLIRKGDLERESTTDEPKRRRLLKAVALDSDDDSRQTSRSGSLTIQISDDDLDDLGVFDQTLAQLQTTFQDTPFNDLKKALKDSQGDFATAASMLLSRSSSQLLDLTSPSKNASPSSKALPMSSRPAEKTRPLMSKSTSSSLARRKAAYSSDGSDADSFDDDDGPNKYKAQDRKEERALQFFNSATVLELRELTGCSKNQATGIIELRPFDNYDNLCVTLRKTKGVGEKIVNNYLTTTDAIRAVDTMLKTVDRVRQDLVGTLSVWCGDEHGKLFENSTSSNSMAVIDSPESGEPSGANEGDDNNDDDDDDDKTSEPGMELLEVDADKIAQTEAGKNAMKGFIRKQPSNMAPGFQLKGYQLLGINWLALLWRKGLSGILADEMGLGKTAQVIAFLAHLLEKGEDGPFLVIVPASTLSNWMREFEKFCPTLDVRAYYGTMAEREEMRQEFDEDPSYNVVVTTYTIATGNTDERKFLSRRHFKGIILDEGHMIKNCTSVRYKQLMSIKTDFRLLLTGTPLQNNLEELLSLLVFIMPKLFAEHEEVLRTMFKVKVDATSEKSTLLSQERIVRARHMIAPFVLRRKKIHVLKDLPRKIERVIYCDLHPDQRVLYDRIISSAELQAALLDPEDTLDAVELDGMSAKAKAKALAAQKAKAKKSNATSKWKANEFANMLMQLRKAADHPMLFRELYTDDKLKKMAKVITKEVEFCDSNIDFIEEDMSVMTDFELHRLCKQYKSVNRFALPGNQWMHAGKVQELERLLPKLIHDNNSRILIFSQFTMVLDILESILKTMNFKYLRMDGATKVEERQPLIDSFNDDDSHKIFLLSTKAGGFGINLTGANVVIMYDLDFNPHNDKQAEDRAHRVGQTREVEVIKLISKGTIEEQVLQLANLKLKLDQHVSQDDTDAGGAKTDTSSSSSSTPSAGILSLLKQNIKAAHSAAAIQHDPATPRRVVAADNGDGDEQKGMDAKKARSATADVPAAPAPAERPQRARSSSLSSLGSVDSLSS
ncbi:hypothetical protein BGZ98_005812 [Dissophora globulifera]|nr:hypothetical protein BGZ98_005812 [Dissophora globulifera]